MTSDRKTFLESKNNCKNKYRDYSIIW